MKKDNSHPLDPRELRRRAELRLQKSGLIPNSTTSQEDLQRLLHEFPVHQIELEMQNEQLQYAYDAISYYKSAKPYQVISSLHRAITTCNKDSTQA